jgi:AcrR family transcriptional regulator
LEDIVDAGVTLIRRDGFTEVTMKAVAAELGVTPMAIYYYVSDKDELLRLASDRIIKETPPLAMGPEGWKISLERYLLRLWEDTVDYPGLGAYLINTPTLGITREKRTKAEAFFEEAGFSASTAKMAWSLAYSYVLGRITIDARLDGGGAEIRRRSGLSSRDLLTFGVNTLIEGLEEILIAESAVAPEPVRRSSP